jgi:type I restriction enzyme S subunit
MEKVKILKAVDIINDSVSEYEGLRPFLSTGDLNLSTIINLELHTFSEKPSRANLNVSEGDIILARMQGTVKVKVIQNEDENIIVSTGFLVLRPKINATNKFLFHLLRSSTFQNEKDKLCTGATQKAINNSNFEKLEIPLPPLPTQQKIATILDQASTIIANNRSIVDKYNTLTQSLFLEMFGDPVKNEKGFSIKKLEECYYSKKEGTKCGPFGGALKKEEFVKMGIPVWNMDNISKAGELVPAINLWITEEKYNVLNSYSVINDDIIISRAGTVGKMCVVNTDFKKSIISTNLIRLRLDKNKLLPMYFVLLMNYFKDRISRLKTGSESAFTHMNTGVLNEIILPLPPLNLQTEFAERVAVIESQKQQAQLALAKSEELFNSLLQRAFKGELN